MKRVNLIIAALLIGSTMFGQTALNQYTSIPNIEKLDVSQQGSSNVKDYVLFASSTELYYSSFEITNNQFGPFNSSNLLVNDITHAGSSFAIATNTDVITYEMFNNSGIISTVNGNYNSLAIKSNFIIALNNQGPDNVANNIDKSSTQIWLPQTGGYSLQETSGSWRAQLLDHDANDYYYVTKSRQLYASGQRPVGIAGGLNNVNSFYQTLHANNTLKHFGMFVKPNNDTLFYCTYGNNQGFIYNATTDNIDITFTNTNTEITSIDYNKVDNMVYFTKPNDNNVYQLDFSIGSLFNAVYTMNGVTTANELKVDEGGKIWVATNNGVFTSLSITGTITGIDDGNEVSFKDINVYPNPTNEYINVKDVEIGSSFKIHNQLGKLMLEGKVDQHINIGNLDKGIYFLSVEGYRIQKIIKQ
jgi:hypothetical protein